MEHDKNVVVKPLTGAFMNRLLRPVIVAALGTAASGSVAHANVEIGGTAGLHVFSTTNELGVPDVKDAPSERNSALFGLRIGIRS